MSWTMTRYFTLYILAVVVNLKNGVFAAYTSWNETELISPNGTMTSPNYPGYFGSSQCRTWIRPHTNSSLNSALLIRIVENSLIYLTTKNNRKPVSGELLIGGRDIFLSVPNTCCVIHSVNSSCTGNFEIPQICNSTFHFFDHGSNNTSIVRFKPNGYHSSWKPRLFKLYYEYLEETVSVKEITTNGSTPMPITHSSSSMPTISEITKVSTYDSSTASDLRGQDNNTTLCVMTCDAQNVEGPSSFKIPSIAVSALAAAEAIIIAVLVFLRCRNTSPNTSNDSFGATVNEDTVNEAYYEAADDVPNISASKRVVTLTNQPENAYEMDERQMVVNELYTM